MILPTDTKYVFVKFLDYGDTWAIPLDDVKDIDKNAWAKDKSRYVFQGKVDRSPLLQGQSMAWLGSEYLAIVAR